MPKKNFLQTLSTKTLLGRFTLILLVPIVLLQAVNSYIFYQRHWDNVTSRMQTNLAEEIGVICNLIHNKEDYVIQHKNLQPLKIDLRLKKPTDYIKKNQHNQKFINRGELKKLIAKFVLSLGREYYELQELKAKLAGKINRPFSMYYSPDASNIIVDIALDDAVLSLELSHKRVQSPTANIFIAWMLGVSFLLYTIAIMFMRNQLKSIAQLTAFADELGKGHQMHDFKPCGAIEIKRAGESIILMRDRINRQITYRTEMLAHISHDLRTPLTRIKLQIAMLNEKVIKEQMNANISEIENMIVGYLHFAKEEGNENSEKVNFKDLVESIMVLYDDSRLKFSNTSYNIPDLLLRKLAMKRAIQNLLDNALKYCKDRVMVLLDKEDDKVSLTVEDDGPGIKKSMREEVFKPFFKMKPEGDGYGLGLTIVKSVVQSHGGKIYLSRSTMGGLKAHIEIPI